MSNRKNEGKTYVYDGQQRTAEEILDHLNTSLVRWEKDSRVVKTLELIEGRDVLDVGCANGEWARILAEHGCNVTGIDTLASSIEIANDFNKLPNTNFIAGNLFEINFKDNKFDCILFLETIEHVDNPTAFLREFYRILKPSGFLIVSTPNATSYKNIFYQLTFFTRNKQIRLAADISKEPRDTGTQLDHIYSWDFPTLLRLLIRSGFEYCDHRFARAPPLQFRRLKIGKFAQRDSKFLSKLGPFLIDIIIKVRKPIK